MDALRVETKGRKHIMGTSKNPSLWSNCTVSAWATGWTPCGQWVNEWMCASDSEDDRLCANRHLVGTHVFWCGGYNRQLASWDSWSRMVKL